ncbi:MAG: cell division protein FtsL [Desulfosarcina sp.]|nr:cell division protein FtsL [Desulfosarcina sp.]
MTAAGKTSRLGTEVRVRGEQGSSRNRKLRPPGKTMTGLWIVLMVLFFVEALFYAWCRVQCVNAGYGIDRENRRHQALLKERNTLRIELARLKSPERIETIARTRLGLVMPDVQQKVMLP